MPLAGNVSASYLVPRPVLEVLQRPAELSAQTRAGVAQGGFCWVLHGTQLLIWNYREGKDARLRALVLPSEPQGAVYVAIQQRSSALTVTCMTGGGKLTVWLDATHLAIPMEQQITCSASSAAPADCALVTAFSACCVDLGDGSPAFIAAAAVSDGSWIMLQCSPSGIFTKHLALSAAGSESRGVLGALSSAITWAYTDTFDPCAKFLRKQPAGRPASSVSVEAVDSTHFRVLLMSPQAVDCWLVTIGLRPSEVLQWSFANTQIRLADGRNRLAASSNAALHASGPGGRQLALWLSEEVKGGRQQHAVQWLEIAPDGMPSITTGVASVVEGYEKAVAGGTCTVVADYAHASALLRAPDGSCVAFHPAHPAGGACVTVVSDDADNLAVSVAPCSGDEGAAASSGNSVFILLSATYGVVELSTVPDGQGALGLGLEPAAAAARLLDALLAQAAALVAAGGNIGPLAAGLGRRLAAAGVMAPSAQGALAQYSTALLDMLPKAWTDAGAGAALPGTAASQLASASGSTGSSIRAALADKLARHGLLVQCLAAGEVLVGLQPQVQQVFLENEEKLAAVCALVERQTDAAEATMASQLLAGLVSEAGAACAAAAASGAASAPTSLVPGSSALALLSPVELFYARPSASVQALLAAVGRAAHALATEARAGGVSSGATNGLAALRGRALGLCSVVGLAVQAALARRETLAAWGVAVSAPQAAARHGAPHWLASAPSRQSLDQLAQALETLMADMVRSAPPVSAELSSMARALFGVAEQLLAGHAAALASCSAASAASTRDQLLQDYASARRRVLDVLQVVALCELKEASARGALPAGAGSGAGHIEQQLLAWQVEALARAHHAYPTLFAVSQALDAALPLPGGQRRLLQHMATLPAQDGMSGGADDTFMQYVFRRLLADGRHSELLRLPPTFHPVLATFLAPHPHLLSILCMHTGDFASAAGALGQAAASSMADVSAASISAHARMLALRRLAARAAGDAGTEAGAEAALRLLIVQDRLGLFSDNGPLPAAQLLEHALAAAQPSTPLRTANAQPASPVRTNTDVGSLSVRRSPRLAARHGPGTQDAGSPSPSPVLSLLTGIAQQQVASASADTATHGTAPAAYEAEQVEVEGARTAAVCAVEVLACMSPAERAAHASKWQLAWSYVAAADDWAALARARDTQQLSSWEATLRATAVCQAAAAVAACGLALGMGPQGTDSAPVEHIRGWLKAAAGGAVSAAACMLAALEMGLAGGMASALPAPQPLPPSFPMATGMSPGGFSFPSLSQAANEAVPMAH